MSRPILFLAASASFLAVSSCAPQKAPRTASQSTFDSPLLRETDRLSTRMSAIVKEQNADNAAHKRGDLSLEDFKRRTKPRLAEADRIMVSLNRISAEADTIARRSSYSPSYAAGGSYSPSCRSSLDSGTFGSSYQSRPLFSSSSESDDYLTSTTSSSRSRSSYRPTYESDLTFGKTLGGTYGVSDRRGNTTLIERPLGGGYRTTNSSGGTTDWSQSLGGGYTGRSSSGKTYQTGQTLGGQSQIRSSGGSTYTREQTLGGGYRWTRD